MRPWFTLDTENNEYRVMGDTFNIREELKAQGATWNPVRKYWRMTRHIANLNTLRRLGIIRSVRVKQDAFCHEESMVKYLDQVDADRGFTERNFCGNCDSWCNDMVVHIVIEESE